MALNRTGKRRDVWKKLKAKGSTVTVRQWPLIANPSGVGEVRGPTPTDKSVYAFVESATKPPAGGSWLQSGDKKVMLAALDTSLAAFTLTDEDELVIDGRSLQVLASPFPGDGTPIFYQAMAGVDIQSRASSVGAGNST